MIEMNRIYCENNLETMGRMPDGFVDLTVTSPPYDNLRDYNGFSFDFEKVAKELYRVTKAGGVVVWVVGDATVNGSETGTSFKQALFFMDCGFNLHDTMIYEKNGSPFPEQTRYYQKFEFMFVLSKGKPAVTNLIIDRKNKWTEGSWGKKTSYGVDGEKKKHNDYKSDLNGVRFNIWKYNVGFGFNSNDDNFHPASFPEKLAADHIHSWSNKLDLVYDPFCGSGTTCKMAHLQKRNWIGSEISQEYVTLAEKRIAPYLQQTTLDL
jgi:DNA modification methylase